MIYIFLIYGLVDRLQKGFFFGTKNDGLFLRSCLINAAVLVVKTAVSDLFCLARPNTIYESKQFRKTIFENLSWWFVKKIESWNLYDIMITSYMYYSHE